MTVVAVDNLDATPTKEGKHYSVGDPVATVHICPYDGAMMEYNPMVWSWTCPECGNMERLEKGDFIGVTAKERAKEMKHG